MGISITDFKRGDIVITHEGMNGMYGKYVVVGCDENGRVAVLLNPDDKKCRYVLTAPESPDSDEYGLYRSALRVVVGCVEFEDDADEMARFVKLVRVFPPSEASQAQEYFNALTVARKLLVSELVKGLSVEPLNSRLNNPHVITIEDVVRIVSTLESVVDEGVAVARAKEAGFIEDCKALVGEFQRVAAEERSEIDAFMAKVQRESTHLSSEYIHLVDNHYFGFSNIGFLYGDIVRIGLKDNNYQYFQVWGGSNSSVKVCNLADGKYGWLGYDLEVLDEDAEEKDERYEASLTLTMDNKKEYVGTVFLIPTRDPELVSEFDTLHTRQASLLEELYTFTKRYRQGWDDVKKELTEASKQNELGFSVDEWFSGWDYLMTCIVNLIIDAKYREEANILRVQELPKNLADTIEAELVNLTSQGVNARFTQLREALEAVVALNSQK